MYLSRNIIRFIYYLFNFTLMRFLSILINSKRNEYYLNHLKENESIDNYTLINQCVYNPDEPKLNFEINILLINRKNCDKIEKESNHTDSFDHFWDGNIQFPLTRLYWGYRIINFKYRKRQRSLFI